MERSRNAAAQPGFERRRRRHLWNRGLLRCQWASDRRHVLQSESGCAVLLRSPRRGSYEQLDTGNRAIRSTTVGRSHQPQGRRRKGLRCSQDRCELSSPTTDPAARTVSVRQLDQSSGCPGQRTEHSPDHDARTRPLESRDLCVHGDRPRQRRERHLVQTVIHRRGRLQPTCHGPDRGPGRRVHQPSNFQQAERHFDVRDRRPCVGRCELLAQQGAQWCRGEPADGRFRRRRHIDRRRSRHPADRWRPRRLRPHLRHRLTTVQRIPEWHQ